MTEKDEIWRGNTRDGGRVSKGSATPSAVAKSFCDTNADVRSVCSSYILANHFVFKYECV